MMRYAKSSQAESSQGAVMRDMTGKQVRHEIFLLFFETLGLGKKNIYIFEKIFVVFWMFIRTCDA